MRRCIMGLQQGDRVRTESGEVGTVIHIDGLTVFVAFAMPPQAHDIKAFLKSQLTLIDPPGAVSDGPAPLG
jgi:preprotein translocase subunit YajC